MAMVVKYNKVKVLIFRHFFTLYSNKYSSKLNFLQKYSENTVKSTLKCKM